MIPRIDVDLDAAIPSGYSFRTPKRSELSDDGEGFGPFRDTWLIRGVRIAEAADVMREEARLVGLVDSLATTSEEFDALARALEGRQTVPLPSRFTDSPIMARLEPDLEEAQLGEFSPLADLEMGVAGLVYALGALGCWPAASCRGHPDEAAWSPIPVVIFAADRARAETLQPLVASARCGFGVDRGLLAVEARSIEDTMSLARAVLEHRTASRRAKRAR